MDTAGTGAPLGETWGQDPISPASPAPEMGVYSVVMLPPMRLFLFFFNGTQNFLCRSVPRSFTALQAHTEQLYIPSHQITVVTALEAAPPLQFHHTNLSIIL